MEKFLIAVGTVFVVAMVVFFSVLLGTLMGIISGWVVGLFFSETILGILAQLGVTGVAMWQFGAFLGFVGGFFRAYQHNGK